MKSVREEISWALHYDVDDLVYEIAGQDVGLSVGAEVGFPGWVQLQRELALWVDQAVEDFITVQD